VDRYPPVNASDYADALAFVVRRYGARVPDWEIWNEPNLPEALKSATPMADYARIVKAAYPAAKAAGAKTVIAGSLANADFADTEVLYRDYGLKGYFDAFSVHPYSGDRSPLDPYQDQYKDESFVRGVPADARRDGQVRRPEAALADGVRLEHVRPPQRPLLGPLRGPADPGHLPRGGLQPDAAPGATCRWASGTS